MPDYYQLPQPIQFSTHDLHVIVDPRKLEHGVLVRADALVLRMIQDSWPDRPFYFARSAGGYPRALGFENNVLAQGLASKLFVPPPNLAQSKDTLYVQGDGWFDVARSEALWNDVFKGHHAVVSEGQWIDRPSASMPALYVFAGAELADALRVTGRQREANDVIATTKAVAHATNLDPLIAGIEQAYRTPAPGDSSGVTLRVKASDQPRVQSTDPVAKRPKR